MAIPLVQRVRRELYWASPLVLYGMLALFAGELQAERLRSPMRFWRAPGLFSALEMLRSPVALPLGLGLLFAAALHAARSKGARGAVNAVSYPLAFALVVLEVAAHNFYLATGSPLGWRLVSLFLGNFATSLWVLGLARPGLLVAGAVAMGAVVAIPVVSARRRGPAEPLPLPSRRLARGLAAAGAIVFALACVPPLVRADIALAEAPPLHMAVTLFERMRERSRPAPAPLPSASLVASSASHPNLVVVLLESTRAISTTPWNPSLRTTPYLSDLASRGILAENAYAVVPRTSKAVVASLCGEEPELSFALREDAAPVAADCLPALLAAQGYRTAWFQSWSSPFDSFAGLLHQIGVADFEIPTPGPHEGFEPVPFGWEDEVMLGPTKEWLAAGEGKPFLAVYLTLATHFDYRPPSRFGHETFSTDPVVDRYLNGVRYTDSFVKDLMAAYRDAGHGDDTVFVILGDHGEGFGEHGRWQHGDDIYDEGLHVPLVISDPHREPARVTAPVSQLDLVPTLAELAGFSIDGGAYPGASILHPLPPDRVVRAHCWYERRCMAEITGSRKVIDHFGWRPAELFDLAADPAETHDLASDHPGEVSAARADLEDWRARVNARYRAH